MLTDKQKLRLCFDDCTFVRFVKAETSLGGINIEFLINEQDPFSTRTVKAESSIPIDVSGFQIMQFIRIYRPQIYSQIAAKYGTHKVIILREDGMEDIFYIAQHLLNSYGTRTVRC